VKLKKLELYGFKSFAERTTFAFEDSLSALVGPNGSGKSNVVDAIKWVLGERSAQKLRGTEMTNVIFNGSASRKALNYAEVKLTIDNSDRWLPVDYEEVCIGRRVDRTGQSDFSLNGKPCRLKDVQQLLVDTGVGTSCYSLIEQGQIDRILRSNPKERRVIFEEAAGINRFLSQKREAERKLERVSANLARVSDILEEVQRQLRSVKYQAGRARTFKEQTERLLRLRLATSLHSYRELTQRQRDHAERIRETTGEKERLDGDHGAAESEVDSARASLQRAQTELAEARQRLTRIEGRLDALKRESELNLKRREELETQLHAVRQRQRALEQSAEALDAEIDTAEKQLDASRHTLEEKSERFEVAHRESQRARAEITQCRQAIEQKKSAVFDLFQRETQLGNQAEVVAAEKRTLLNRLERLENRATELDEHLERIEHERSRTHDHLEALNADQTAVSERAESLRQALTEARSRLAEISEAESGTKADLSAKMARQELIEDLEARAEGVGAGPRMLIERDLPGTVGLVAAVLDVPLKVAPAVEAVLGCRAQAVVFESAESAREAMAMLAGTSTAQAELIVLDRVSPPARVTPPDHVRTSARLADLVDCSEAAPPLAELLLGNAFLVEDAEDAHQALHQGLPDGCCLVTPAGELYRADGIWSAGRPEAASIISRRSELAQLRSDAETIRQRLEELARAKQNAQGRADELETERAVLSRQAEDLKRSMADVRSHLSLLGSRADENREQRGLSEVEQKTVRGDVDETDRRASQLRDEAARARHDRTQAEEAAQAEQQRLCTLQENEQELAERASTLGAELAAAREQRRSADALLSRLRTERQTRETELSALRDEQSAGERARVDAEHAVESAQQERQALTAEAVRLRESFDTRTAVVAQSQAEIDRLVERTRQLAQQRRAVDENLHSLRLAASETDVKLQDMLDRMAEDCGVHVARLELDPGLWREEPLFTAKEITEFCPSEPEAAPAEPVAAWYRALQSPPEAETEEREEGPERVDLEDAVALRNAVLRLADNPETDWDALRREAAQLKAKVDRIGNVNVDAIREQESLETRLQFLTDQKEDLERARRHEREIIRELSRKSRERFRETFEQIRQSFQALFRKLFGGGTADLLLLEEEDQDILEAGVELNARPPGKQTGSITLLSGGERALTTVALLFALFQAKPSPFCLLDEVDAPLDDANVERFLMLVTEFARDTQFVVITHNKQTMSMSQVLYGLTMTDGVSQKLSVRFEDVDQQVAESSAPRAKAG